MPGWIEYRSDGCQCIFYCDVIIVTDNEHKLLGHWL